MSVCKQKMTNIIEEGGAYQCNFLWTFVHIISIRLFVCSKIILGVIVAYE